MTPAWPSGAAGASTAGGTGTVPFEQPPLPRGPVLDWSSWRRVETPFVHSVQDLPHRALTTSGRAALHHALLQLKAPAGSGVLVPTYHCPTMIAPVLMAGLSPRYFGLCADGSPRLDAIDDATASGCAAMLVPHYFGIARSLAEVRRWCDRRGIALIEDCAHCFFGEAGERPVGAWGDYAIASLSKFFPLPEAGLLASARRPIAPLGLQPAGLGAQAKSWVDVFETASRNQRLRGIGAGLSLLFRLKNGRAAAVPGTEHPAPRSADEFLLDCDMARIGQAPSSASRLLNATLPRGRVIVERQRNYAAYLRRFAGLANARPLMPAAPVPAAPYVFPLWVDDADAVYAALRARRLPVFRWDRVWPGTPALADDHGRPWQHHVLQLLCHQDLGAADVERTADTLIGLLARAADAGHGQAAATR